MSKVMTHTVFVCTTCGAKEGKISKGKGTAIFQKLTSALQGLPNISIKPVGCLSNCERGGTVALVSPGKFSWVFGEQGDDEEAVAALAHAAKTYAVLPDGFLPKIDRAKPVMSRVPPFNYDAD